MMTLADLAAALRAMPRRYPALLVDRIDACTPGVVARGTKCVTVNEHFFQGHFPGYPVLPGVLIIEALVQMCTLLAIESGLPAPTTIRGIDGVRFKRQVIPGDRLELEARLAPDGAFAVRASVDGALAAEGHIVLAVDHAADAASAPPES